MFKITKLVVLEVDTVINSRVEAGEKHRISSQLTLTTVYAEIVN